MLAKGIEQVRTKKMDILGYRKLQALIDFHGNIFDDVEQFDHTLKVLLDELQAPVPQEEAQKPASPAWDLKTQVLCTVQFMFDRAKSHFAGYYPNTIVALLKADKVCEAAPHLSEVIGNLIDDILAEAELVELAYTIVKVIDFKDSDTEFRLFLHGMDVLGRIVGRLNERKMSLPDDTTESIAELSARALKKDGLGHQKAVIVTCVELRKMIASDGRLFTLMRNPDEQTRQLIMYYKMRETVY
ncbi:hypothetical protein BJY04DRAFT_190315 [Aspergillus karnatakaensis]|uniref:uncharacterized protein n=1 Tax=Aspergillus karnatakaensis TaxID=1810916 RepID=UPI003CCE191B